MATKINSKTGGKKVFRLSRASLLFSALVFAAIGAGLFGMNNSSINSTLAASNYPNIPSHNSSIPAGSIYVATNGNDNNQGSASSPLRTISKAVDKAQAGGTIVVREGLYREGGKWIMKQLTIMSYPGEQVWMTGMDVVTSWNSEGNGRYSVAWDTPNYCGGKYYEFSFDNPDFLANRGPCMHVDMNGGTENPMAWDPQMVYLNDEYVKQVDSLSEVSGNSFYYDLQAKKLTIGFNPAGQKVEVTKRPNALIYSGTSQNSKIIGIGFMRYATNEHSNNITNAAVYAARDGMTVDGSFFWQMATAGLNSASAKNLTVKNSIFKDNGGNGAGANGSNTTSGLIDNVIFEKNIFDNNNLENYGVNCNISCAQAGVKMAHMVGAEIRHNIFINNNGNGYWCDLACKDVNIYGNYVANNTQNGIFYEVSESGIIASNMVINNGWGKGIEYGIKVTSYDTKVYNNTLIDNAMHIHIFDDSRPYQAGEWGPNTGKIEVVNNVMSGGNKYRMVTLTSGSINMADFITKYNYNSYHRPNNYPSTIIWHEKSSGNQGHNSLGSIRSSLGYEQNGFDEGGATDPFFVNQQAEDYAVRDSSQMAYQNGQALPSDINGLLAIKPAGSVSRGAVYWVNSNFSFKKSPQNSGNNSSADINADGIVDIVDLSILLSAWGNSGLPADINNDSTVDIVDLSILLSNWTG